MAYSNAEKQRRFRKKYKSQQEMIMEKLDEQTKAIKDLFTITKYVYQEIKKNETK